MRLLELDDRRRVDPVLGDQRAGNRGDREQEQQHQRGAHRRELPPGPAQRTRTAAARGPGRRPGGGPDRRLRAGGGASCSSATATRGSDGGVNRAHLNLHPRDHRVPGAREAAARRRSPASPRRSRITHSWCRRTNANGAHHPPNASAATMNGMPRPRQYTKARKLPRARIGAVGRQHQHRGERRPDARRPAEPEQHAQQGRRPHAHGRQPMHPHVALEPREEAHEHQAQHRSPARRAPW